MRSGAAWTELEMVRFSETSMTTRVTSSGCVPSRVAKTWARAKASVAEVAAVISNVSASTARRKPDLAFMASILSHR
jgi:hypothetical protein